MIIEKRTLPIGVEYDGKLHNELEVRPRLVRDFIKAAGDQAFQEDKNAHEVCCLAAQITKLGDVPLEAVNGSLLMDMHEADFDVLAEAAEMARQRARTFRPGTPDDKEGGAAASQDGVRAG
jgi:hypothetical protein